PGTLLVFDYPAYLEGNRSAVVLFDPDAHTSLVDFTFTAHYLIITTLPDVPTSLSVLTAGDWTPVDVNGLPDMATISVLDTDPDHSAE
ncbi:S9 family peptidase, partial [Mycobacterium tuberculosis]|nr:S9 family peptidase [Mycobacterium tuberculosis]